ncbi:glycosyltransferase family 9 protein [Sphaerisporangium sp. NPDC005288]|uniref:glycosyltransferase family 9 protein n=1 Tax=Sphaerisporangium sp. NPDC005288 TaxID=3155114 RepID=UPI0033BBBCA7
MAPVLVALRGLGLGDLLTAVPALRGLRRAYPGHRIVLATPAPLAELVRTIDAVDDSVDVSGTGPVPVRAPDIAVNLHGSGPQSTAALLATSPGRLLCHAHPDLPQVQGPPWRHDVHEVVRWCALLGWYGLPADPGDLALPPPSRPPMVRPDEADGYAVVHPGAAFPARRWPPDRFAEVAAWLHRAGHRVLITGGDAERDLALRVAALAGIPERRVVAGRTNIGDLAALVASARLVVCGDTGVAHLATAYATPSVVLFGPTPPRLWGPPEGGPHIPLWAGRSGDPHGGTPDPGLLRINVRDVLDAIATLLKGHPW